MLITDQCHLDDLEARGAGKVVPDTIDGLTAGLETLLAVDREGLAAMGVRGREIVAAEYGWDRIAARLTALYAGQVA